MSLLRFNREYILYMVYCNLGLNCGHLARVVTLR